MYSGVYDLYSSPDEHREQILASLDELTEDVPYYDPVAIRHIFYDLALQFDEPEILEVACGYGKMTPYLAAAAKGSDGTVRAVDHERCTWEGQSVVDRVTAVDAADVCRFEFGEDARWYLLELFTGAPGQWVDFAYLDLAHVVEVDAFAALALWTHLEPGGVLVMDDLDWVPAEDATEETGATRSGVSNVEAVFDYVTRLPDAEDWTRWREQGWDREWGFVQKGPRSELAFEVSEFVARQ